MSRNAGKRSFAAFPHRMFTFVAKLNAAVRNEERFELLPFHRASSSSSGKLALLFLLSSSSACAAKT